MSYSEILRYASDYDFAPPPINLPPSNAHQPTRTLFSPRTVFHLFHPVGSLLGLSQHD